MVYIFLSCKGVKIGGWTFFFFLAKDFTSLEEQVVSSMVADTTSLRAQPG